MITNKILLFIAFSIIIIGLSGCFGTDNISIPLGDGESISVGGSEEGGFTLEAEDKDGETFSLSSSKDVPEEFPSEIPFPNEYQIINTAKINDNGNEAITVSYLTETMSVDGLLEMYKTFMEENGYESNMEISTDGYNTLSMQKDENEAINITLIEEDVENNKQVTVSINYLLSAPSE